MHNYLIQQQIQPLVNQYAVYDGGESPDGNATQGELIAFAQQKRFSFKEKFTAYTSQDKQAVAFEIQARQVLDFGARYDISDPSGVHLGTIGKDFKSSLLRSTWHVFRPGQEDKPALVVQERDASIAILRRIWGFVPIVGDFPFFLKYHFDFTDPASGQIIASYNKTTTVRDHYVLAIKNVEGFEAIDPRVLISLGIMMDALQSR